MHSFFLRLIVPYKRLDYFGSYFETTRKITCDDDHSLIRLYRAIIVLTIVKSVHFMFLYLFPLTGQRRRLLFDFVFQVTGRIEINALMAFISLMTGYFYYLVYFANNNSLCQHLYEVLVCGKSDFFLDRYHKGQYVIKQVRKTALFLINGTQCFILAIGKNSFILNGNNKTGNTFTPNTQTY